MKLTRFFLVAGAATLFFSCKKEASNGDAGADDTKQSTVTYQLATSSSAMPGIAGESGRTTGGFLTWTGGTASVSEIKFEAKGDNKLEYKSNIPHIIHLGDSSSTIGNISIPYGTYKKVEFKIKFAPRDTTASLELEGMYTPTGGGTAVPVIIRFYEPFELKFEKKTPTTIDANTDYNALSTLALGLLNQSVPESLLINAAQTNGTIIISNTSNTHLYNPLWSVFQSLLKVEIKKK